MINVMSEDVIPYNGNDGHVLYFERKGDCKIVECRLLYSSSLKSVRSISVDFQNP